VNHPEPAPPPATLDRLRVPRHIAIIMDGNGRWAASRGLPRATGHRAGRDAIRRTIEACREIGVSILTLYAFSTENWRRSPNEIESLMDLFHESLIQEANELHRSGIRLRMSGDLSTMPPEIREQFERVEALTRENQALILNIAVNYGETPYSVDMRWLRNAGLATRVSYVAGRWGRKERDLALIVPSGVLGLLAPGGVKCNIHGPEMRAASRRSIDRFGFRKTIELIIECCEMAEGGPQYELRFVGGGELDRRPC